MAADKDPFTKQPLVDCIVETPNGATPCEQTPPIMVNDHPYTYAYGKSVKWPQAAINAARDAGLTVTVTD